MTYRFVDHTADMGIEVEASSFEELLAESLVALTDSLTEVTDVRGLVERGVSLEAASREELLVDWLNELVFLFEVESMLFRRAELAIAEKAGGWRLQAVLWGEPYDAARHEIKTLIKAVTYHQLQVVWSSRGWRARVIFDL
jgi:SHS2 domain-containing protein